MDSNIKCFKIEGRMKSPTYVGLVTKIYKDLMIKYENGLPLEINKEDEENLRAVFNRGYTSGYLFSSADIMNPKAPNHAGIYLGKVVDITAKKIKIKLARDLKQFNSIRFKDSDIGITINFLYDKNDNLISQAKSGDIVYLDNFINLKTLQDIYLTNPNILEVKQITKKININMTFKAIAEKPIELTVDDGKNSVIVKGPASLKAINCPMTSQDIEKNLRKVKDTPFQINNLNIHLSDNLFIKVSDINALRRDALSNFKKLKESGKVTYTKEKPVINYKKWPKEAKISVLVRTKDQIKACKKLGITNIICSDPLLLEENFIYKLSRVSQNINFTHQKLLVTTLTSLDKYPGQMADYYLNVTNHYTLNYLLNQAKIITLSPELEEKQIARLLSNYEEKPNVEVLVYGRVELMIMKYCLLKKYINKDKVCHVCQNNHVYYLKDRNQKFYPIICNPLNHHNVILNCEITNLIAKIPTYKKMGVNCFRIELFDEDYDLTLKIIKNAQQLFDK